MILFLKFVTSSTSFQNASTLFPFGLLNSPALTGSLSFEINDSSVLLFTFLILKEYRFPIMNTRRLWLFRTLKLILSSWGSRLFEVTKYLKISKNVSSFSLSKIFLASAYPLFKFFIILFIYFFSLKYSLYNFFLSSKPSTVLVSNNWIFCSYWVASFFKCKTNVL